MVAPTRGLFNRKPGDKSQGAKRKAGTAFAMPACPPS